MEMKEKLVLPLIKCCKRTLFDIASSKHAQNCSELLGDIDSIIKSDIKHCRKENKMLVF